MKNNIILEQCLKTLNSNEFKEEIRNFIRPIFECLYKEISIYLFFFIFFKNFFNHKNFYSILRFI